MNGVPDLAQPDEPVSAGEPGRISTVARIATKLAVISLGLVFGPIGIAGAQARDAGSPPPQGAPASPPVAGTPGGATPRSPVVDPGPGEGSTSPAPDDDAASTQKGSPDATDSTSGTGIATDKLSAMSLEDLLQVRLRVRVASLFAKSRLEAPSTVAVVTEDDWRRRGARRMLDTLSNQPGMVVYPTVFGGDAVSVRGYAQQSTSRNIGVLLDGVPLNDLNYGSALIGRQFALDTLQRVELLRGPGSAVYGTDAFQGVISLRSFSPDSDRYEARSEVGSDGYHQVAARASHGLGHGLRFTTATGYGAALDPGQDYNFTDAMTGTVASASRRNGWRTLTSTSSLRYADGPWDGEVGYTGLWGIAREATGIGTVSTGGFNITGSHDVTDLDQTFHLGRGRVALKLPEGLRAELSGYGWYDDRTEKGEAMLPDPRLQGQLGVFQQHYRQDRMSARATLGQEGEDRRFEWVAGYEFTRFWLSKSDSTTATADGSVMFANYQAPADDRNIHSLIVSTNTAIIPGKLELSVGGRLDEYSDYGLQLTPRAGLVFLPAPDTAVKLLYGRAYRAPLPQEARGIPHYIRGGGSSLRNELIDTLELVFQVQRPHWTMDVTGFGSLWTDGLTIRPVMDDPEFNSEYVNVGKSHAAGVEANARYVTGPFRLDASASYVWSEQLAETGPDLTFTAFPDVILNVGAGYTIKPARLELYLSQRLMTGMTDGAPSLSIRGPVQGDRPLDPYYRVDLNATFAWVPDRLWVDVNLRNMLALDNRVPNLNNGEYGLCDVGINASLGVRIAY